MLSLSLSLFTSTCRQYFFFYFHSIPKLNCKRKHPQGISYYLPFFPDTEMKLAKFGENFCYNGGRTMNCIVEEEHIPRNESNTFYLFIIFLFCPFLTHSFIIGEPKVAYKRNESSGQSSTETFALPYAFVPFYPHIYMYINPEGFFFIFFYFRLTLDLTTDANIFFFLVRKEIFRWWVHLCIQRKNLPRTKLAIFSNFSYLSEIHF